MLNYIVFVNKEKESVIVLDYETDNPQCVPEIGYEADPYYEWESSIKELITIKGIDVHFDIHKAFDTSGIYKIYGYDASHDTPDGYYEGYEVVKIEKIQEIKY